MTATGSPAPGPATDVAGDPGVGALRALAAVVPPVTAITALMFYFGWASTYAEARYLGTDASLFGYSLQDYLLRSVDSLFLPLIVLAAVVLAALLAHRGVRARLGRGADTGLARVALGLLALGVALLAYGGLYGMVTYRVGDRTLDVTGPLALGAGVSLLAYGWWLRGAARREPGLRAGLSAWQQGAAAGLLAVIVGLSLFWAVGNVAVWRGRDLGAALAAGFRSRPQVVVYAEHGLGIEGAGVVAVQIAGDQRYHVRYTGLYLLDKAGGSYFLLPQDWSPTQRTIIVLPADDQVRLDTTG